MSGTNGPLNGPLNGSLNSPMNGSADPTSSLYKPQAPGTDPTWHYFEHSHGAYSLI
jgi:hypothetical protein